MMQNDPIVMPSSAIDALTMAKQLLDRHAITNTKAYKLAMESALEHGSIDCYLAEIIKSQI